jgi:hypothetical protein
VAYVEDLGAEGKDLRLNFLGPFDMGNTKGWQRLFQILNVLRCLVRWGDGEFRAWVQREVLDTHRPKTGF